MSDENALALFENFKTTNESVTKGDRLKLPAFDGKSHLTDVAGSENLLLIIQSDARSKSRADLTPAGRWRAKTNTPSLPTSSTRNGTGSRNLEVAQSRRPTFPYELDNTYGSR